MTLFTTGSRVISIMLSGSCFLLAAGGVFQTRADFYLKQGEYEKAAAFSQQALKYDRHNAESLYLRGQSSWNLWIQTKSPQALTQAFEAFTALTEIHPGYAKGWFYKALSEKELLLSRGALTEHDRLKISGTFKQALTLEPHSPWMLVFTALEQLENLSGPSKERQTGPLLKQIRTALRHHYVNQSSPYLEDVYRRLMSLGYDESRLQEVTPKEPQSYFRLLQFYKARKAFGAYRRVEDAYAALNRKFYNQLCDQADSWLEKGAKERALAAYGYAVSQMPLGARARAGQLASGSTASLKMLEALLVQEEEDLSFYWDYLASEIKGSRSPYLEGLLHFQREQYAEAAVLLEQVDLSAYKPVRRFLARALTESGRLEQARGVLKPMLEADKPDLRELLLLERIAADEDNIAENQKIQEKIETAVTRKVSSQAWWSETAGTGSLVGEEELSGIQINLQPGRVQIDLLLKLEQGTSPRLAKIRVWEEDREQFSGSVIAGPTWQRGRLEFETTGGWRWLQVTLEKEALPAGKENMQSQVRLGPVQLEYPE